MSIEILNTRSNSSKGLTRFNSLCFSLYGFVPNLQPQSAATSKTLSYYTHSHDRPYKQKIFIHSQSKLLLHFEHFDTHFNFLSTSILQLSHIKHKIGKYSSCKIRTLGVFPLASVFHCRVKQSESKLSISVQFFWYLPIKILKIQKIYIFNRKQRKYTTQYKMLIS